MYYTSENKNDLIDYNNEVTEKEGYKSTTVKWSSVVEHQNGIDYAIKKHDKYLCDLETLEELTSDWFTE